MKAMVLMPRIITPAAASQKNLTGDQESRRPGGTRAVSKQLDRLLISCAPDLL
jgi:hypothetical protein